MSNFTATLRDLIGRATGGPYKRVHDFPAGMPPEDGHRITCFSGEATIYALKRWPDGQVDRMVLPYKPEDADLIWLLLNHAEAVLAVVEAARDVVKHYDPPSGSVTVHGELRRALAHLDAGGE